MIRAATLCMVMAGAALVGGILTLQVGQAPEVAIGELLLAVLYAALSLRVPDEE
jgi:hypothetical protein